MKKNRLWSLCVLLLIAVALVAYAEGSLLAIPNQFQYLWAAPAQTQVEGAATTETDAASAPQSGTDENATQPTAVNSGLRTARESMEAVNTALEGACDVTTLYAIAEGTSVNVQDGEAVIARLEGLEDGAYALKPINLYTGRLIYPEEFQMGQRVAMIDEQLAVALFKYAEPIDRKILLGSDEYRIVGIVRDTKQVGDQQEYTLYVPYRSLEKSSTLVDALCIQSRPIAGAGGWSAFESTMTTLSVKGTCISLSKECRNAALPLRMLGCIAGFMVALWLIRLLNRRTMRAYHEYQSRLQNQYAARLLPWVLGQGALLAVGYLACVAMLAELFVVIVAPVYTFPEWVPAVLVEPTEIQAAFWNVWQKQAALLEIRSPELIRVRFFRELMAWGCGACALFGGMLAIKARQVLKETVRKKEILATTTNPTEKTKE